MAESIRSDEIFGRTTTGSGERPLHTQLEHRYCAFYPVLGDTIHEGPGAPITPFIEMECPHGFSGGGAWYNEDYVLELVQAAQRLIELHDRMPMVTMKQVVSGAVTTPPIIQEKLIFLGDVDITIVPYIKKIVEELRRLAR